MPTIQNMLSTAFAFHQSGFPGKAEPIYRQIIELTPKNTTALTLLGTACLQLKKHNEAISLFEKSLSIDPKQPDAWVNIGNAHLELDQHSLALSCYHQALFIKPDYIQVHLNCGNIYRDCGAQEQAITCYKKAAELQPSYTEAYNNLGLILWEMKKYDESIKQFKKALALSPSSPQIYNHLGRALGDNGDFSGAMSAYEKSIQLDTTSPAPYVGLGIVYYELSQHEKSLAYYDIALSKDPKNPDANFSKSTLLLLLGRLKEGWDLYEYRWKIKDRKKPVPPHASTPLTNTNEIRDKTILLQSEQGFGDIIQFTRYALVLKNKGASVIIETRPPLVRLLSSISPDITVITEENPSIVKADFYAPLMSLPGILGTDTIDSIPSPAPYLSVDKESINRWNSILGEKKFIRIGLVWSGSITHKGDHRRSIPVELLKPLIETGHEFHCLQKEIRPQDREHLSQMINIHLHDSHINNFSDTAALISLMDLVISVDTSTAHLAGALGKQTWVLLPQAPDYRWLLNRTDSPWYPTLRLFRQESGRNWQDVITTVRTALQTHFL